VLLGVERPPGLSDVTDVRHWSYPTYTRVVIELTRPVTTEVKRLAADRSVRRPERLYLDLPGVWVGLRYDDPIPVGDGLLEGIRLGQNSLTTTRLVIDLKRYDHHRLFFLSSPNREWIRSRGMVNRDTPATGERLFRQNWTTLLVSLSVLPATSSFAIRTIT
jgi:N-acetylmuramoyl-L-alanine amidase